MTRATVDITLTVEEQGWWDDIQAYFSNRGRFGMDRGEFRTEHIGLKQSRLTVSLYKRNAIPDRRWEWVNNADFNIGTKKSRWELIRDRAGSKKSSLVFQLPFWGEHYLPFLLGIVDLPQSVIDDFRTESAKCWHNAYDMGQMFRAVAKAHNLEKRHAEEFFKLAIDCEYDHYDCRTIRDAIFTYLRK